MTPATRYLEIISYAAPLDADAQRVLTLARAAGRPPYESLTAQEARLAYAQGRRVLAPAPPIVAAVRDMEIPGPGGSIAIRIYRGSATMPGTKLPVLLYFHGGGWVVGDLDSHDALCRGVANAARCSVVAIDYRLAPEHKFPAAIDDAAAAARWLHDHATELDLDRDRMAVGGDSAGGNLAAALALMSKDGVVPPLCFQVLIYPCTDLGLRHDAYRRDIKDLALTASTMRWFRAQYLRSEADEDDWRASPLRAPSLSGTPPAFVVTAGHDPVSDEGEAYACRLRDEGVPVVHRHLPDQIHGFMAMGGMIRLAGLMIDEIGTALNACWRFSPEG
jgi:acetyl esterase